MNTFLKALVLSVSTTLVAAPVFAAPQQDHQQPSQVKKAPAPQHANQDKKPAPQNVKSQQNKTPNKPTNNLKVGQKLPKQYQAKQYHVTQKADKRLSKPGKNQQWLKVNGEYVLTQGTSYSIVKIIR